MQASHSNEPVSFLRSLCEAQPSNEHARRLAGATANVIKVNDSPQLAALYLQAVARHITSRESSVAMAATTPPSAVLRESQRIEIAEVSPSLATNK